MKLKRIGITILAIILSINNINCYANEKYLSTSFWHNNFVANKISRNDGQGKYFDINYNCLLDENNIIALNVEFNEQSKDDFKYDSFSLLCYISDGSGITIYELNNKKELITNNTANVSRYNSHFSKVSTSYICRGYIKLKQLSENAKFSIYLTIDNTNILIAESIKPKELVDSTSESNEETKSASSNVTKESTTKSKLESSSKSESTTKGKYSSDELIEASENSTNIESEIETETKYYGKTDQKAVIKGDSNKDNSNGKQKIVIIKDSNSQTDNSQSLSSTSKIAIIIGLAILALGLLSIIYSLLIKNKP